MIKQLDTYLTQSEKIQLEQYQLYCSRVLLDECFLFVFVRNVGIFLLVLKMDCVKF